VQFDEETPSSALQGPHQVSLDEAFGWALAQS
jgi:hypothetical protein